MDFDALVELAGRVLAEREALEGTLDAELEDDVLRDILRIGSSAGGARAKAIIAWNEATKQMRPGDIAAGEGFTYWLLKLDGVAGNRDKEREDPKGYGLVEYAYYLMAKAAGIEMQESRLHKEGGRSHFMTRRFDRTESGKKIHMQSLCAMRHLDFRQAGAHSYEQALRTIRDLGLPMAAVEEQFRRMAFNIVARNQDDHTKNIAFLMNRAGEWSLSPAFDMTYSYKPRGAWTGSHQMSLNGKRDRFAMEDFKVCATGACMKRGRAEEIVKQVQDAVLRWETFADEAGVAAANATRIAKVHRIGIIIK